MKLRKTVVLLASASVSLSFADIRDGGFVYMGSCQGDSVAEIEERIGVMFWKESARSMP